MGIAAFEFEWDYKKLGTETTVRPTLELLSAAQERPVPILHRRVATRGELAHWLRRCTHRRNGRYHIILIAGHGRRGGVVNAGTSDGSDGFVCLDWLAEQLARRLHRRMLYVASCATLDTSRSRLRSFIEQTGTAALCGYSRIVHHAPVAAWETLFLDRALRYTMDGRGTRHLTAWGRSAAVSRPFRSLGFRMVERTRSRNTIQPTVDFSEAPR